MYLTQSKTAVGVFFSTLLYHVSLWYLGAETGYRVVTPYRRREKNVRKGGCSKKWASPPFWHFGPLWKKRLVWGGKTQKKSAKKNLWLHDTHKMYILQKNWTKTVNPALSSGLNFFPPPIWGHHHQLDDHQRNPNMNNRDHLVGQLTS